MKSGYIIFALVIISITLTAAITMTIVSEFGIRSEKNIFVRLLFEKLGMWAFPVFDIGGILFIYFTLTVLRKFDVRVASTYLLTIMLFSISDLAHDTYNLVTHNPLFSLPALFLLLPVFTILSLYLSGTNKIPPLEF